MSFISAAKHVKFIQSLKSSVEVFDGLSGKEELTIDKLPVLREDLKELENIYKEYSLKTAELRMLIKKYSQLQRRSRVILRQEKLKYMRSFGTTSNGNFI